MNINRIHITLIPSACSKVKMRESDYNSAWTVRCYCSSIYRHETKPGWNYIHDPQHLSIDNLDYKGLVGLFFFCLTWTKADGCFGIYLMMLGASSITDIEGRIGLGRGGGPPKVVTESILRFDDIRHNWRSAFRGIYGGAGSRGQAQARRSLSQGRALSRARQSLHPRAGLRPCLLHVLLGAGRRHACIVVACVIMVGESLTRERSCCHCAPTALRGVGTPIEWGCLPAAFGRALPHVLSFSPETGSCEEDMVVLGEGHYRNLALCRVPNILPSVFFRALGKEALCRVPRKKHSVKENTRRRVSLPSVIFLTLGKELFAECFFQH
jgi:hypothetical protein